VAHGSTLLLEYLAALLLVELLFVPLIVLAHELGHAAVALRAAPGPVIVLVGRPAAATTIEFERLVIHLSPIPARGIFLRGSCHWAGSTASARAQLTFFLSGPAAALALGLLMAGGALATATMSAWLPCTLGIAALAAVVSALFDVSPWPSNPIRPDAHSRIGRDGPKALGAYRDWRAQATPPASRAEVR
jgi:hypothetical protein